MTLGNWFNIPDNLVYKGIQGGYDSWSEPGCDKQHPGAVCEDILAVTNTTTPYKITTSYEARPHRFEHNWWLQDTWTAWNPGKHLVQRYLPAKWETTCYNEDNGFTVNPVRGYVSTKSGMDNFTVVLAAKPVASQGNVTLKFVYGVGQCTKCVTFVLANGQSADGITFDAKTWKTPVTVYLKYLSDGETYFFITATGGGYGISHWYYDGRFDGSPQQRTISYSMRSLTCANGIPGYGCNTHNNKRSTELQDPKNVEIAPF